MEIDVSKLTTSPQTQVERLYVTVFSTDSIQKIAFKGFAKSVTCLDHKGPFDVLPRHENFVSKLSKSVKIVRENGEIANFEVAEGVIEVANNIVRIFLNEVKEAPVKKPLANKAS